MRGRHDNNVETLHRAEIKHAVHVRNFRGMQSFHDNSPECAGSRAADVRAGRRSITFLLINRVARVACLLVAYPSAEAREVAATSADLTVALRSRTAEAGAGGHGPSTRWFCGSFTGRVAAGHDLGRC